MSTEAVNQRQPQNDLIISAKEVREFFLFGVDLTDDSGSEMSDRLIEFYIRSAQSWLQIKIPGIQLCPKQIVEWHDYRLSDYVTYNFVKLFRYPTISVEDVSIQFPLSENILQFDPSWYRAESVGSQINLFPTQGTFSSIVLSQGGSYIPLVYSGIEYVPHMMRVTYTAGFKKGQVPQNLKEIVGMKAAMGPLNIAGDLIAGAGIASKSISLDGLSQSVSTTSSATNSGYGARIGQYEKQIKEMLEDLRNHHLGLQMVTA
jgi:hypothetical protein